MLQWVAIHGEGSSSSSGSSTLQGEVSAAVGIFYTHLWKNTHWAVGLWDLPSVFEPWYVQPELIGIILDVTCLRRYRHTYDYPWVTGSRLWCHILSAADCFCCSRTHEEHPRLFTAASALFPAEHHQGYASAPRPAPSTDAVIYSERERCETTGKSSWALQNTISCKNYSPQTVALRRKRNRKTGLCLCCFYN